MRRRGLIAMLVGALLVAGCSSSLGDPQGGADDQREADERQALDARWGIGAQQAIDILWASEEVGEDARVLGVIGNEAPGPMGTQLVGDPDPRLGDGQLTAWLLNVQPGPNAGPVTYKVDQEGTVEEIRRAPGSEADASTSQEAASGAEAIEEFELPSREAAGAATSLAAFEQRISQERSSLDEMSVLQYACCNPGSSGQSWSITVDGPDGRAAVHVDEAGQARLTTVQQELEAELNRSQPSAEVPLDPGQVPSSIRATVWWNPEGGPESAPINVTLDREDGSPLEPQSAEWQTARWVGTYVDPPDGPYVLNASVDEADLSSDRSETVQVDVVFTFPTPGGSDR